SVDLDRWRVDEALLFVCLRDGSDGAAQLQAEIGRDSALATFVAVGKREPARAARMTRHARDRCDVDPEHSIGRQETQPHAKLGGCAVEAHVWQELGAETDGREQSEEATAQIHSGFEGVRGCGSIRSSWMHRVAD